MAFVLHDIGPERIAAAKSRALIERPPLCPRQGGPALGRQDARAGTEAKIKLIQVSRFDATIKDLQIPAP